MDGSDSRAPLRPPPAAATLAPREATLAALELYRLRLAGVLNWLDLAAAGRAGGGAALGAAGAGKAPELSCDPDAIQQALDSCVEYLLVGEAVFQGERERMQAHAQRYEELAALRARVAHARSELGNTVAAVLAVQATLDARGAEAARLVQRMHVLQQARAHESTGLIVGAAERFAYTSGGESWTRRPQVIPEEAIIRQSALFTEQALAAHKLASAPKDPQNAGGGAAAAGSNGPTCAPWMDLGPWLPRPPSSGEPAAADGQEPAAPRAAAGSSFPPAEEEILPPVPSARHVAVPRSAELLVEARASTIAAPPPAPSSRTNRPEDSATAPTAAPAPAHIAHPQPTLPSKLPSGAASSTTGPGTGALALIAKLTPAQRKQLLAKLPAGWRPGQPLPPGTPDLAVLIQQLV